MNTSDSERIAAFLEENNYSLAEKITEADLAIFNTCGIKQTAENRAYSMINNLRKEKRQNVKIVMTGCLAHRPDVQKRMKDKVDAFSEVKDFEKSIATIQKLNAVYDRDYLSIIPKHKNNFTAYVPIMTGCNNFCAYCVVPYARGREISRPADEILNEVKDLISKGYKNIILLGQNVNSYESESQKVRKSENKITFSQLLKKINTIPGKFWIQFVSSHPKDMSDELIETIAKSKKVCENVHLPIQSGDDEILRRMNRKYDQKHYLKLIKKIKNAFKKYKPNSSYSISSDIIVGFPGETRKQFMESATVMEKVKFDMVFFGQYSPRPGTVAWKMKDNVSQKEKAKREKFLNEILKKTALKNNQAYLNKYMEVLVEKEKDGAYFGKIRSMKNIKLNTSKKNLVGKIITAKIISVDTWNLEGKL